MKKFKPEDKCQGSILRGTDGAQDLIRKYPKNSFGVLMKIIKVKGASKRPNLIKFRIF